MNLGEKLNIKVMEISAPLYSWCGYSHYSVKEIDLTLINANLWNLH